MRRKALITGITGQDGSYLAEWLLERGYEVHGTTRQYPLPECSRIGHLCGSPEAGPRVVLHLASLEEPATLRRALLAADPDEVYHLAGQSHVGLSFEQPEATCNATGMGAVRLLELLRELKRPSRLFQASSAEVFGRPACSPQDEDTPVRPVTPYGCAVAFATHLARSYRVNYGLHACCGILYNHESPRRGDRFVTRKITRAAAAIKLGQQETLTLGNLDARRDWGHARDYVQAMWLALQQAEPRDYVIATGCLHTVREVVTTAFGHLGLDWERHVRVDPRFLRPADPQELVGNAARARELLGWTPTTGFEAMIREMVEADFLDLRNANTPAPGVGVGATPAVA
jgi:GDPmannose 4,6-dehydratase